jgi:hypothetical protein
MRFIPTLQERQSLFSQHLEVIV